MERPLQNEAARQRAVAWVIALTAGTVLAPNRYERKLLTHYAQGVLTLDEVSTLLAQSVYHVLYRSQSTSFPTEAQLQDLLAQSRTYNAQHGISGLLLYSEGYFVQVIEGAEATIRSLYARIQQDRRHAHVTTLREGPGPQRWFADWHLALGYVAPVELSHLLWVVESGRLPLLPFDDPHVQTLVDAFGLHT